MYVCTYVIMSLEIGIWNLYVFIDIFRSFLHFFFYERDFLKMIVTAHSLYEEWVEVTG